jgi:hypothetical protein
VGPGEFVSIVYNLQLAGTYADVLAELTNGDRACRTRGARLAVAYRPSSDSLNLNIQTSMIA